MGSYILPWGIPSSSWGPFRLLLSHGPLPSHPSFFAERPTGSCVLPRPRAAGRRRPPSPRPRPPRPGPAPALPGREAAGPSGSTHPLGHVGGSQSACGARGGGGRGGPWPEVADAPPFAALSPGLRLQPGRAARAELVLPTRWQAFWVPRPAGWNRVSGCPRPPCPAEPGTRPPSARGCEGRRFQVVGLLRNRSKAWRSLGI